MRSLAAAAAASFALTIVMTWPLATRLSASLPGDYGDPVFVSWVIGWVTRTLTAALSTPSVLADFWNANIFFPERQTLAFSEHFIGQSILVLPVYWLTRNLILCYNVAFLATFALSGLGALLLARTLTGSHLGGVTSGVVFAFNQYRLVYEVSHLHVLSIHWLPFALLGLHRYLVTDSRAPLAWGVLALAALNVSSVYYAAYCAPFILALVIVDLVHVGRWREGRVWLELWAAAAAVAVITAPFLLPYIEVQQRLGILRGPQELMQFSATLDHYRAAMPGLIVPMVLALLAFAPERRKERGTFRPRAMPLAHLALLVLAVWLSLGPVVQSGGRALEVPGLYGFLNEHVPGYSGLRVPARYAMLFFFFLALLAGMGASRMASWAPRAARAIVAIVLILYVWQTKPAALPLDQALPSAGLAPAPAYLTPTPTLPPIYREVDSLSSAAVLAEFPFGDSWYDLRYMFFAATHGRRLMNGYSGIFPPSYLVRQKVLSQPLLDPERSTAALSGATHVIVHRAGWVDDLGLKIGAWLETLGATALAEADGATLYQLPVPLGLARDAVTALSDWVICD